MMRKPWNGSVEKLDLNEDQRITFLLQGSIQDEAKRINQTFNLMLSFQSYLNETQRKKLTQVTSEWVRKMD